MEPKPEQYLRQIRDVMVKNRQLLEQLVAYNQKQEKRRKWRIMGRISMTLMPFLLTILLGWFFYSKIVNTLGSFQDSLADMLPDFPSMSEIRESDFLKGILGDTNE